LDKPTVAEQLWDLVGVVMSLATWEGMGSENLTQEEEKKVMSIIKIGYCGFVSIRHLLHTLPDFLGKRFEVGRPGIHEFWQARQTL
jgi:hypothetical protein